MNNIRKKIKENTIGRKENPRESTRFGVIWENGLPLLKQKGKLEIIIDLEEKIMKLGYSYDASKTYNWKCSAGILKYDWNMGDKSRLN